MFRLEQFSKARKKQICFADCKNKNCPEKILQNKKFEPFKKVAFKLQ